jgi:hypothetical protein
MKKERRKIINADEFISRGKVLSEIIIKRTAFYFMFICWHSDGIFDVMLRPAVLKFLSFIKCKEADKHSRD